MKWLSFLTIILLLFSCEKSVSITLDNASDVLVVEATIENNRSPVVILTKSKDFFSKISPQMLADLYVHDAEVYVSNGITTEKLKEYTIQAAPLVKLYYYSTDTSQPSALKGALNGAYTLRIVSAGKEYGASTTIPALQHRVDSLWWKPLPDSDTSVIVMTRLKDNPAFGNYLRYFTKTNSGGFLPPFSSVFDDFVINGKTYEVPVEPGVNRNIGSYDDDDYFKRGDTVTMKLTNIDRSTYDFWRTMEYSYGSVGNPFASPVKVLGNISGGALGYFGGYAAQYHQIIIPK